MLIGIILMFLGLGFGFASFFGGAYLINSNKPKLSCIGMIGMLVGGFVATVGCVFSLISIFQYLS